jgi:gluconokinase/6-phosphogluconolactonase
LRLILIMGVAGSGKSTIGALLAERLGASFSDGDSFHPPANIAKMSAGTPLTDEDRRPWLEAIAAHIDSLRAKGERAVVACSALKRAYRRILIGERRDVRLVYLDADRAAIVSRFGERTGHFMPVSLVESQFAALEPPSADENPVVVSIARSPAEIVDAILKEVS